jgi:hypothetical protein
MLWNVSLLCICRMSAPSVTRSFSDALQAQSCVAPNVV